VPALEEPGAALLYLVGGDENLRNCLREADILEVPFRDLLDALRRIFLLRQASHAVYPVPHWEGEDLPALGFVEIDQLLGTVLGPAILSRLG
jgi:hypothetical protein